MYLSADWVVKAVMIGLVLASLVTWTVLIVKQRELARRRRRLRAARNLLAGSRQLPDPGEFPADGDDTARQLLEAARAELALSSTLDAPAGVKERVASRFSRIELGWLREARQGIGILASIGAVAPFVGLFGTVWGIMNSFIGIAQANTTNLAVVAPGIAEALLATALGLVAAIPAVVIYNHFTRSLGSLRGELGDVSALIEQTVSRELDRGATGNAD
ncbi:tonB-system energizer ExbB [Lysobacter pythonis]|uniref:Biopolymer transport protein ExbB n=2 Tax=Solilutibacter pythonis TaxID=2483112 RepID=A0A3M2HM59_9GAMM|nr:tonB-system energizer ExbB [Lysobacter pythonis]